jgi:hypothetical protein
MTITILDPLTGKLVVLVVGTNSLQISASGLLASTNIDHLRAAPAKRGICDVRTAAKARAVGWL